jgi:HEAT repeat protein
MLEDEDYDVRTSTVKALGLLGQAGAIPALRRIVERDRPEMARAYAAEALAKLEEPADRDTLLGMVQESDLLKQYLGACGLLKLGDATGMQALGKLTESKSENVRRIAAAALCAGNIRVPTPLLLAMAQNEDPYVRASTAKALSSLEEPLWLQTLLRLADDQEEFQLQADDQELFHLGARKRLKVCAVAAEALASSRSPQAMEKLLQLAGDSDASVSMAATKALPSRAGIEDDATVLRWANDPSEQIRQATAELLGIRRAPRGLDKLLALADDPSAPVRASALAAMGHFGDSCVLDRLMSGLEDVAWQAQWGAAIGLEAMAQQAVDSLIQKMNQTEDPGQLARAVWVLDKLGDPVAVRPVILTRGTAELTIWQRVVAEAVEAGDRTVMESLIAALRNGDPRVRESAAEALGALGDRSAVIPLAGLLGDPDWQVRQVVASTLSRIGSSAVDLLAITLREGNKKVRAGIADLLGKLRTPEAVDPLIQALDDEGRLVRANAAAALGSIGDPHAVRPLVHSMQDSDRGVRNNAAAALRHIGTPEALATVKEWTLTRRRRASAALLDESAR